MDIQPNSVANSVAEVRSVACIVDNLTRNPVKINTAESSFSCFYQGLIAAQNNIINLPLLIRHLSHMDSPRHIADIVILVATKVHGQGFTILDDLVTSHAMRHSRTVARSDDEVKRGT